MRSDRTQKQDRKPGRRGRGRRHCLNNGSSAAASRAGAATLLPFLDERIEIRIPSRIDYLDHVLDHLNHCVVDFGLVNPGDCDVMIALDEAIVNAIRHGNKSDPAKAVHIVAEINSEGARFTIKDEGGGFKKEALPDPTEPSRLLVPSGRGLLLINHIMDEVSHNERGNEIQMVKRCGKIDKAR